MREKKVKTIMSIQVNFEEEEFRLLQERLGGDRDPEDFIHDLVVKSLRRWKRGKKEKATE